MRHFLNHRSYRKPIFGIAVSILLSLAASVKADVDISIRDIDVSLIPDLRQPGDAWKRISTQSFYVFTGLEVPLVSISGTNTNWFIEDAQLREWTFEFPQPNALHETVRLSDGTVVGGPTPNHLRFIKPEGQNVFEPIPEAADLYWSDSVEGSDVIFAKMSMDGALLTFDGEAFVPSPIPEIGQTRQGEFLPWYSKALDGYFTAWAGDIWFHRTGDPDWHQVQENQARSWAPSWGFYERGSQEILSPDGTLLKVISENQQTLGQYRISEGAPTEMLPSLLGQWHQVSGSSEIVGWRGSWQRNLLDTDDHERVAERTPQFVRIRPNSDVPEIYPDLRPLILSYDENSISYQYRFAAMPETDRLYFLHENGFAYYSNGVVKFLPTEWLDTVGNLPRFFATQHRLYVAASNGLYLLGEDDTLNQVLEPQTQSGFGVNDEVFDLGCDGYGVGFFGWQTGIYSLDPTGMVTLVAQSPSPIRVYGLMPDGRSILFSEQDGRLKLLSAEC